MTSTRSALILVDVQYDFLELGALAVKNANEVLSPIYKLIESQDWSLIVASQDYHPPKHISFSSTHPNTTPFSKITLPLTNLNTAEGSREQDLWPDHCIQFTKGCEIEEGVLNRLNEFEAKGGVVKIVRKGYERDQDAYSAFHSIEATPSTKPISLSKVLREANLQEVYVVGLATDYCVRATTIDALTENEGEKGAGWKVFVIKDACRGVDPVQSEVVLKELEGMGVEVVGMEKF